MIDQSINARAQRAADFDCYDETEKARYVNGYATGATQQRAIICGYLDQHAGQAITPEMVDYLRTLGDTPTVPGVTYYERHREEIKAKMRQWREEHPGYQKKYNQEHARRYRQQRHVYYMTHREELLTKAKARKEVKANNK